MDKFKGKLFIDVFTPAKLNSFGVPKRIRDRFAAEPFGNFICAGPPGAGKSSIIKWYLKNYNIPYLYINAAESGNIDNLRVSMESFCTEIQLVEVDGIPKRADIKYIFLDEIDGASKAFLEALKGFTDVHSKSTRFCATTNYYQKLPEPIKSRFELIDFNLIGEEERKEVYDLYSRRMKAIITQSLESEIDDESFNKLVNTHFPDYRGILQDLEKIYRSGVRSITLDSYFSKTLEYKDLFDLICTQTQVHEFYKKISGKYAGSVYEVMDSLHKDFIPYLESYYPSALRAIPMILVSIWEHQKSLPEVIDPSLALESLAFKLNQFILNAKK